MALPCTSAPSKSAIPWHVRLGTPWAHPLAETPAGSRTCKVWTCKHSEPHITCHMRPLLLVVAWPMMCEVRNATPCVLCWSAWKVWTFLSVPMLAAEMVPVGRRTWHCTGCPTASEAKPLVMMVGRMGNSTPKPVGSSMWSEWNEHHAAAGNPLSRLCMPVCCASCASDGAKSADMRRAESPSLGNQHVTVRERARNKGCRLVAQCRCMPCTPSHLTCI